MRKTMVALGLIYVMNTAGKLQARNEPYNPDANRADLGLKHHHAELSDLVHRYEFGGKTESENIRVFSLEEMVRLLKYENMDIRMNAERVYQAKKNIDVSLGALLPSLNFGNIVAAMEQNFFDLVPSLVGFMFPSNWFRWEESILFFEAERWGHIALSANQINTLLTSVYKVSYIDSLIQAYKLYYSKIHVLSDQAKMRLELGEGRLDARLELENLELLLYEDILALENEIKKLKYYLCYVVNLDESKWNRFDVEKIPLPDLFQAQRAIPAQIMSRVMQVSPEIRELEYLREASRLSIKSRAFDFLNPNGGGGTNLGVGYISQIKAGKSQIRELDLQTQELKNSLKLATYQASEDYNLALNHYKNQSRGLSNAEKWFGFLEKRYFEGGEYEAQDFVEAVNSMLEFHSKKLNSQHQFLISAENLNRLTLGTTSYQNLSELTPQRPYRSLCLTKKIENRRIKKAKKSGKLKLEIPAYAG